MSTETIWKTITNPANDPPVKTEQKPPSKPKGKVATSGQHSHYCHHCGVVWWHGHEAENSWDAHRCPKCGRHVFRINSDA